ncbi:hypothetical protein [Aggregatibacter actinomycetemcomitans]|uniref:hypothetical protein n=1 Tax=Aggregatibacter actinomycetemcomitans TaxID=714 RepID=UPI001E633D9A|nr:hypothetical protein [Aggregatibacter actinomycetemcomitans]
MESLFEANTTNGNIRLNPTYQQQLHALFTHIKDTLVSSTSETDSTDTIFLNHWAYRLSGIIWHSLEFYNSNKGSYILTLSEMKCVEFADFSFTASEGEICVYDSLDVNGFIYHLHQYLKNERINLIFSFSNSCS